MGATGTFRVREEAAELEILLVLAVVGFVIWWRSDQRGDMSRWRFYCWEGIDERARWWACAPSVLWLIAASNEPLLVLFGTPVVFVATGWTVTTLSASTRVAKEAVRGSVELWDGSRDVRRRWAEQTAQVAVESVEWVQAAIRRFIADWRAYSSAWGAWPGASAGPGTSAGAGTGGASGNDHRSRGPSRPPTKSADPTPYEILDLADGTPLDEVRAQHRRLVMRFHPDRHPGLEAGARAEMDDRMKVINAAFDAINAMARYAA